MESKEMKYDEIFARSFSKHEQKKLGYAALGACFGFALCLCTVFKPYLGPLPVLDLRLTMEDGLKMAMVSEETSKRKQSYVEIKPSNLICDTSNPRSDVCKMNGDVRIQGNTSTIFVASSHTGNRSWTIRPYPRKGDGYALSMVRNFTIEPVDPQNSRTMPKCSETHNVPALVFSAGGYSGNNFHGFTDVIVPLYITAREFNGDVRFLIANRQPSWTKKFEAILEHLSSYEIIDIDKEIKVHCFPSMIIGLKKDRKELNIEPSKSRYSMLDFKKFLRSSYSLERVMAIKLSERMAKKPRLLIVSRPRARSFTNEEEIVRAAENMGFEVILAKMTANLSQISRLVNSCDLMMGVHGAGLTNLVFLPDNAVLIQILPWGKMDWIAKTYFGEPAKRLGLNYLEYKISEQESSLIKQYPLDHPVFKDPGSLHKKGWIPFRSVYLDKQNVTLDVVRFRETLLQALRLLHV